MHLACTQYTVFVCGGPAILIGIYRVCAFVMGERTNENVGLRVTSSLGCGRMNGIDISPR